MMTLNPQQISVRDRLILAGLFLSKYDTVGLKKLGFDSFVEAFNVLGYALGGKPASIKNYRDEFDPLFPNVRKGWHKRSTRAYCRAVFDEYENLDLDTFSGLIKSFAGYDENAWSKVMLKGEEGTSESFFAKRLMTGLAAEKYFVAVQPKLLQFKDCVVENTTLLGCGYDFRLRGKSDKDFFAVEVKGLQEKKGSMSMTPKEYEIAATLAERFFLFVVKNFKESPFHDIYPNPLASDLRFIKKERVTVSISWQTRV